MSKKSSLVGYYLVSVDNYKTLSELKRQNSELEKKLSDSLKYQKLASGEKVTQLESEIKKLEAQLEVYKKKDGERKAPEAATAVSTVHYEPPNNPNEQQGSGLSQLDGEQFRAKLFASFEEFLKSKNINQSGSGAANDLTPVVPIPMLEPPSLPAEVKPSEFATDLDVHNVEKRSTAHSASSANSDLSLDEEKLLATVKSRFKDKAKKFLSELKEHKDVISVEPDGAILIDGQLLPKGNFYELFPKLFNPPKNFRNNCALATLVDELATLGMGHLIMRNFTVGLTPKGRNYLKERAELRKVGRDKWYYLGENE